MTSCEKIEVFNHIVNGTFINDEFVFPMNTITQIKMYYKSQYQEVIQGFDQIVQSLSAQVDRYHDYDGIVNLKTINDSCGSNQKIEVSRELFEAIRLAIDLTKLTKGKFHLAMGTLIDLYAPYLEEEVIKTYDEFPISQEQIDAVLEGIPSYTEIEDYIQLDEENYSILLLPYHEKAIVLSLGGIAKGFVMQKAYDYLDAYRYPCIFDAGSSTLATIGKNPANKNHRWRITFRGPSLNDQQDYLCVVELQQNNLLSTSGDYQQNFLYQDGDQKKLMHHILDVTNGKSNNFLRSVSLVSQNASLAILDALSTALFNCEDMNEMTSLLKEIENFYDVKVDYLIATSIMNNDQLNFDNYNLFMNQSFSKKVVSSYSKHAKEITIIEDSI